MSAVQTPSKNSGIKIALAVIPALLILSIIIALYLGANEEPEVQRPVEGEVTVPELADYLKKLNLDIAEKSFGSKAGVLGLKQTWAMIQGTLEPPNLGYLVSKSANDNAAGKLWPTLWVDVGVPDSREVVVVAVPYGESGTPVAFSLGLAEYFARNSMKKGLRLVFYPPLVEGDLQNWIWSRVSDDDESLTAFVQVRGSGSAQHWAELDTNFGFADAMEQLVSKKGWEGNLVLEKKDAKVITVRLGEQGESSLSGHAERLLRVLPAMKFLLEKLES